MIDDLFILTWHPQYDTIETDEMDYQEIVSIVRKEIAETGTISKSTFIRILDWKASRLKGIVRLNEYETYAATIKVTPYMPDEAKLAELTRLYGVAVALGSTILHFIYPDSFPIMDMRTAEILYSSQYIKSKCRTIEHYYPFRDAILGIHRNHPQWSLRAIDRALFAYHKLEFARGVRLYGCPVSEKVDGALKKENKVDAFGMEGFIERISQRENSGQYVLLTDNQKKLYAVTKEMSNGSANVVLTRQGIKERFRYRYPEEKDFESCRNMLPDFCYNKINKDDKPNKFLYAKNKNGEFNFVDFDWDNANKQVDIYWKYTDIGRTFCVGYYKNKEFFWDFATVLECVRDRS